MECAKCASARLEVSLSLCIALLGTTFFLYIALHDIGHTGPCITHIYSNIKEKSTWEKWFNMISSLENFESITYYTDPFCSSGFCFCCCYCKNIGEESWRSSLEYLTSTAGVQSLHLGYSIWGLWWMNWSLGTFLSGILHFATNLIPVIFAFSSIPFISVYPSHASATGLVDQHPV